MQGGFLFWFSVEINGIHFFFEVRHPHCVSNKSNVKCIQYDIKHNLVLDDILVY